MSNIEDGGPAFPHDNQELGDRHRVAQPGMSLRDWFAGQCAAAALVNARGIDEATADMAFPLVARLSYKMADALLASRSEPTP